MKRCRGKGEGAGGVQVECRCSCRCRAAEVQISLCAEVKRMCRNGAEVVKRLWCVCVDQAVQVQRCRSGAGAELQNCRGTEANRCRGDVVVHIGCSGGPC